MHRFRTLNPDSVTRTLERLQLRIEERFPSAGLGNVAGELTEFAKGAKARAEEIAAPNLWVRAGTALVLLLGVVLLYYVGGIIQFKRAADNLSGVMQGIEAAVSLLVFMGGAIFFLSTLETRWKRQLALADLNELRTIIHVIDMHQLTKDPSATVSVTSRTAHSPSRDLTPFELMRYLDYASEMLSLTAKVAALYGQSFHDPVVLETASELGQVTNNMTNKIWQKITIIQTNENWKVETAARARARLTQADPGSWAAKPQPPDKTG